MQICSQNKGEISLRKRNPLQKSSEVNFYLNHNLNNANVTPQTLVPNTLGFTILTTTIKQRSSHQVHKSAESGFGFGKRGCVCAGIFIDMTKNWL